MNISINPSVQAPQLVAQAQASQKSEQKTPQEISLKQDSVEIKRGLSPTLKGGLAGALGAGGLTIAFFAATGGFHGEGAILSVPLSFATALGGAVGGATSANTTSSKLKGALAGAAGGAVLGAVGVGVMNKSLGGAVSGAILGGITGAVGGVFGAFVAQKK